MSLCSLLKAVQLHTFQICTLANAEHWSPELSQENNVARNKCSMK